MLGAILTCNLWLDGIQLHATISTRRSTLDLVKSHLTLYVACLQPLYGRTSGKIHIFPYASNSTKAKSFIPVPRLTKILYNRIMYLPYTTCTYIIYCTYAFMYLSYEYVLICFSGKKCINKIASSCLKFQTLKPASNCSKW